MSYRIVPTHRFEKELKRLAKKYRSLKDEFSDLLDDIEQNPKLGTPLGNGCYKIRIAIRSKGKGKSGGARVITYLYMTTKTVYLLTIFDKSERADLRSGELEGMMNDLDL